MSQDLETLFGFQCKTFRIQDLNSNLTFDYQNISLLVTQRVAELAEAGIKPRSRYLLKGENKYSFFVDLFALWKLQAHPVILNPDMTEHESFLIREQILKKSATLPDDTAFVLLTSGTTADPKSVVHTFDSLKARLRILNNAIPIEDRTKTICLLPLYFGHGLIGLSLLSIYSGQHLIIAPALNFNNSVSLAKYFELTQPTFISSTPALWEIILRSIPAPQKTLKRVQIASAPAHIKLLDRIKTWAGCPLYNVYGLTECASWISDSLYQNKIVSVGNGQNWSVKFRISEVDAEGEGAIEVQTPGIFWGYWDYEGPSYIDKDNWFRTGDYGSLSSNGELFLVGRESRIINRQGLKVSAEEVEKYILDIPEIIDAVVLAVGTDNSQVGALIVSKQSSADIAKTSLQIANNLKEKISLFKIPSQFKITTFIPRKPNGKPDLKKIKALWDIL